MDLLKDYIRKQEAEALQHLQSFAQNSDAEAIHQLRVCMKKLQAAYRFIIHVHPSKKLAKAYRRQFKKLFALAGAIREKQLMKERLARHELDVLSFASRFLNDVPQLTEQFHQQTKRFQEFLSSFSHQLVHLVQKTGEEALSAYAIRLQNELVTVADAAEQRQWHELRKQMKQLLYSYHWLHASGKLKLMRVREVQQLNTLQERIGEWHDLIDFKNWLGAEAFYLHTDEQVQIAFRKAWNLVQKQIATTERNISPALTAFMKRNTSAKK